AFPLMTLLAAACGGGGTDNVGSDSTKDCRPGILSGFSGDFSDQPIRVVRGNEGEGGEGIGGAGDGAVGIGAGGSLGQFTNAEITVEFADGSKLGPTLIDSDKGMVTVVPCDRPAPAMLTLSAAPGSNATYFDEALNREVPFGGLQLRSVITSFDRNAGITAFTEAMVRRAEKNAETANDVGPPANGVAIARQEKVSIKQAWKDTSAIEQAHDQILLAINDQLPGDYRLDDLRRLPVILNEERARANSNALTDDQNGRYGAALAALASTAAANLGDNPRPAETIAAQLADDLSDGVIDLTTSGQSVAPIESTGYTPESFWTLQTRNVTDAAQTAGVASLAAPDLILSQSIYNRAIQGFEFTVEVNHRSDGLFTIDWSEQGNSRVLIPECVRNTTTFSNVREKHLFSAIGGDGKTLYSALPAINARDCRANPVIAFDIPGASIASMIGDGTVRTTDGRIFLYTDSSFISFAPQGWHELVALGIKSRFITGTFPNNFWAITESGGLARLIFELDASYFNTQTRRWEASPGPNLVDQLPNPVTQLVFTSDAREALALTAGREVYWLNVTDPSGLRDATVVPTAVKVSTQEPICWISRGVVGIACDGKVYYQFKPIPEPTYPPMVVERDAAGRGDRIAFGVSGIDVTRELVPEGKQAWRSTKGLSSPFDQGFLQEEATTQPVIITVDGSLIPVPDNAGSNPGPGDGGSSPSS
ncbi:MAG: hypothetical protein AB8C46_25500, partial [Burkholderiaceae bacterium]